MRALTVAFDATGVRVEQSLALPGRVKAPPLSYAEYRVEFEVYDAAGRRIYDGSFDDPRHGHADKLGPNGEFIPVEGPTTENSLLLRLPAELAAARIQLFEVHAGAARKPIGSVDLL